jgi:putative tricarboxylic transport membrane protein
LKGEGKSLTKEKVIASILFVFSLLYTFNAFRLKPGTIKNPGPGFIPIFVGVLLLLCTILYLIRIFSLRSLDEKKAKDTLTEPVNYRAILGILASTMIYPFLLPALKFVISTMAVTFAMVIVLKPRRPVYTLFFASVASISAFLIFARLLGVALPAGYIEEILYRIGG